MSSGLFSSYGTRPVASGSQMRYHGGRLRLSICEVMSYMLQFNYRVNSLGKITQKVSLAVASFLGFTFGHCRKLRQTTWQDGTAYSSALPSAPTHFSL
ncbi:MAG: hypothetical protein HKL81_05125 [Acidimicrobiaceae bacterium]|nr:hypothetical protein [Acidimicrobiaceae bacterium]